MNTVAEKIDAARCAISDAARRSGRGAEDVELLAVCKTFPAEAVREAVEAGQRLFGENRVQELLSKQPLLPSHLRWHLIGHLQSNKIRKVLPCVEAIQGVDSLALARDIDRVAGELGLFPKVYLEVNVAAEASKFGFAPAMLEAQLEELITLKRLEIQGLMCIPPQGKEAEDSRKHFIFLREFRDKLERQSGASLAKLSMGMSHDYAIAVEEGATLVRVGSAIFGGR